MYQTDSKEKICLNCRYWQSNAELIIQAQTDMCTRGMGHTGAYDTCSMFLADAGKKDLNIYFK